MSKHTTYPLPWRYRGGQYNGDVHRNSHTNNVPGIITDYPIGNWNHHKKRRIPSHLRTKGRRARWELRYAERLTRKTKAMSEQLS